MLKWVFVSLIIIWIIVMWYVVIYAFVRGWGPVIRSKRRKKEGVAARIKSKQGRQEFNHLTQQMEFTQKVLLFECEDGIERDYEVHDDIWDWVENGDEGILEYQGELFVAFHAHRPRYDMEKELKRLMR